MTGTLVQRSWASEARALLAVANKEWTILRRYPSWIVMVLVWPIMFPLASILTARALSGPDNAALAHFNQMTGTTDYISFIVIGNMLYMWLNITLWDIGLLLRNEQMRGTLESNWLCPVWRMSIVVGGSLTKLLTSLFFLVVTVVEFWLVFGVQVLGGNIGLALLILVLTIPSIYGIGIAFGALVLRFKEANALVFLVRGIAMIFCGVTYPLVVLPLWMQSVARYLPLTYTIQGIRDASLRGAPLAELTPVLGALALFAIGLPLLGYLAFTFVERRARRTGALAQY